MKEPKAFLKQAVFTAVILGLSFFLSVGIEKVTESYLLISAVFSLAVYLISFTTEGYFWGILSSLVSVMAVNYAFTFPYFKLNFSITENFLSAIILLVLTIMTSAVTTKLKYHEKLKTEAEKERIRANLLRAISHDLRTPLTTIYGSSSALIENYDNFSDEQILKLANGIKEDADWLISMVENLLSVTRVQNDSVSLIKEQVVLEELVDAALVRFKRKYPNQEVEVSLPEEFVSIAADSMLITQVLVNMLENAVKHAKGMTKLSLNTGVSDGYVMFEVVDDGCGMPEELLGNIFTGYFEKKDAPVDRQKHCMGIGLSVCASIIKAHDGEIRVRNLRDGGCAFRFRLKCEEDSDE